MAKGGKRWAVWADGQNAALTSVLKVAAVCRKSSQISCIPSVSQVEFSRQEKNPQPTATAPFKHLATSAAHTHETFANVEPGSAFISSSVHAIID